MLFAMVSLLNMITHGRVNANISVSKKPLFDCMLMWCLFNSVSKQDLPYLGYNRVTNTQQMTVSSTAYGIV